MNSRHLLAALALTTPALAQTNTYPFPASGGVGIGTTNPRSHFQVVGTITAGSSAGSTYGIDHLYGLYGSGALFVLGSQHSSGASFLGYAVKAKPGAVGYVSSTEIPVGRSAVEASTGHISFFTGGTQTSTDGGPVSISERLRIDQNGNVGIGTTNPTHKLAVNGTIKAKEIIVETTGWSDYVFADDYRLAPLAEVEAHIKTNKHLPGLPSAAEVAENGLSVGDMQARLLAKIEELTLHMIAQEKRATEQERRLSTRIETLEAENRRLQVR